MTRVSTEKRGSAPSKSELRRMMLQKRRDLDAGYVHRAAALIHQAALSLECIRDAPAVLTYVGSKDNEVDTLGLIGLLLDADMPAYVPLMQPPRDLAWIRIGDVAVLKPNPHGILEPPFAVTRPYDPEAPVFVPGVAWTREGHRIGYGGGYFDRFLKKHAGPTIGLAYEAQLVDSLPLEPHDLPVDYVVTEERVYRVAAGRA